MSTLCVLPTDRVTVTRAAVTDMYLSGDAGKGGEAPTAYGHSTVGGTTSGGLSGRGGVRWSLVHHTSAVQHTRVFPTVNRDNDEHEVTRFDVVLLTQLVRRDTDALIHGPTTDPARVAMPPTLELDAVSATALLADDDDAVVHPMKSDVVLVTKADAGIVEPLAPTTAPMPELDATPPLVVALRESEVTLLQTTHSVALTAVVIAVPRCPLVAMALPTPALDAVRILPSTLLEDEDDTVHHATKSVALFTTVAVAIPADTVAATPPTAEVDDTCDGPLPAPFDVVITLLQPTNTVEPLPACAIDDPTPHMQAMALPTPELAATFPAPMLFDVDDTVLQPT